MTYYADMAIKKMDLDEFLEFLKKKQGDQTAASFASAIGVSPQYLSDVYNGRREPGESITSALKIQRVTTYVVTPTETSEDKK